MSQIEIIGSTLSNFAWTAAIACAEKGVDFVVRPARPHTPDVDAIHPLGRIPVMRHGDLTLFESRAICAYVDSLEGPPLMPRDPREAARAEQWVSLLITASDAAIVRAYLLAYLFPGTPDGATDPARIAAATPNLEKHLRIYDRQLAAHPFVAGAAFTLADCYLTPMLAGVSRFPEGKQILAQTPALAAYLTTQLARPSVARTKPQPPKG